MPATPSAASTPNRAFPASSPRLTSNSRATTPTASETSKRSARLSRESRDRESRNCPNPAKRNAESRTPQIAASEAISVIYVGRPEQTRRIVS